jgi:hypothetical protein
MDKNQEQTKIVKQFHNEMWAGALLIPTGVILMGIGIGVAIRNENPMMLCFSLLGGLSIVAGSVLIKGAMTFGSRAFKRASKLPETLSDALPHDNEG